MSNTMRFKNLPIYSMALTLLTLAMLACGPADESVQRELGNLPPALPALQDQVTQSETDSEIAGAMTIPTPTLVPLPVDGPGTPAAASGSPQEDSEEEDAPTATPQPTATPEEDAPTPPPTICVAWPTQEAGDPDTMCLTPESMLPGPTPVYPKLGEAGRKVVDAEKRAADEVARGVAKDISETTVASEMITVFVHSASRADDPAVESWLKAKRLSYRKDSYDTESVYTVDVPALSLGELSKLEAVAFIRWSRPTTLP